MRPGRPKEFDEREALEQAMNLFWARGYEKVTLSDLQAHMGISRQSLYDTFGTKRELFIRTIEHYRATQLAQALAMLSREGSPLENVKAVVRFFDELASAPSGRGCLVANAVVEIAPHDAEIAELLRETLELLRESIERALHAAREQGELPPRKSPEQLSLALTNALMGMVVTGKLPTGGPMLQGLTSATLSMLE